MNSLICLQETITATGTPQNLPSNPVANKITLQAFSTNAAAVVVGNAQAVTIHSGFLLERGSAITIDLPCGNTDQAWIVGTAGDILSVVGA